MVERKFYPCNWKDTFHHTYKRVYPQSYSLLPEARFTSQTVSLAQSCHSSCMLSSRQSDVPFPTVGSTSGPRPPSPSQHLAATTEATSPAMTVHLILQQSHEGHLGTETPDSSCSLQMAHVGRLVIGQQGQGSEVSAEMTGIPFSPGKFRPRLFLAMCWPRSVWRCVPLGLRALNGPFYPRLNSVPQILVCPWSLGMWLCVEIESLRLLLVKMKSRCTEVGPECNGWCPHMKATSRHRWRRTGRRTVTVGAEESWTMQLQPRTPGIPGPTSSWEGGRRRSPHAHLGSGLPATEL